MVRMGIGEWGWDRKRDWEVRILKSMLTDIYFLLWLVVHKEERVVLLLCMYDGSCGLDCGFTRS